MTNFTMFAGGLLIAGLGVCSAPVSAASLFDTTMRTQEVRIDDLNLSSAAGVAALNLRLLLAARAVCGEQDAPVSLSDRGFHGCMTQSLRDAHLKVDAVVAAARSRAAITLADR